ncbi:MAG: glycosyltransferase family 4 protein [Chthoniobacterales bacterium]|nr:glycosyltransferase family 4 protein [Chthoniobacterales bacterium]
MPGAPVRVAFSTTVRDRANATATLDGIARYTAELSEGLAAMADVELFPFVLAPEKLSTAGGAGTPLGSFKLQALCALLSGMPFPMVQRRLAGVADLVHSTDHFIPKLRGIPVVATLHDAIPLSHPEWINYSFKSAKNALWRKSAQWADHIITVSEHSKREISRWFDIPPERITVTPLGVDARWAQDVPEDEIERVRSFYRLPPRFVLFLGTLQPRKNIARLIAAHRRLPDALRREAPLVVAGRAGWLCGNEIATLRNGDGDTLRYLDHVLEADLLPILKQASVFALPSLHEGFGLPILEAFAAGTPVVASTAGSIPEVAGSAAMLFDPSDIKAMADAMQTCLEDAALADSFRELGRARAKEFPWARTAELTLATYEKVLGLGQPAGSLT